MSDSNRRIREMNIRTVQQLKESLIERREKREFVRKKTSDFFQKEYGIQSFWCVTFRNNISRNDSKSFRNYGGSRKTDNQFGLANTESKQTGLPNGNPVLNLLEDSVRNGY